MSDGAAVADLIWRYIVNLNKLLRTALKTGMYVLEQSGTATEPIREQVRTQDDEEIDRMRQAASAPQDHAVRNVVGLAVGIGFGFALGMLFAPASGEEIRRSIVEKAQDAQVRLQARFSSEKSSPAA